VPIEPVDVVALVRAAVTEDVDLVFAHRAHDRRRGDGSADRRRVVVLPPRGAEVKGAALERDDAFLRHRLAAVEQPRLDGAVAERLLRDVADVALVGLSEVCGVRVDLQSPVLEPGDGAARVEATRESDGDGLAGVGKLAEDAGHGVALEITQWAKEANQRSK